MLVIWSAASVIEIIYVCTLESVTWSSIIRSSGDIGVGVLLNPQYTHPAISIVVSTTCFDFIS